ncbi:hypothetical protein T05_5381 [Trichinella murrelli]|uniref:Uncharacterized protein n=1 Tax=Trichinella murrelli TaxID=144512 RepID=A0A0V0TKP9_9BILA|nr:hypothetical protein T05_5381 [Trichinella murrelli]
MDTSKRRGKQQNQISNETASLRTHQEIFIHRIRYRALHYANNDRHKGPLSFATLQSFVRPTCPVETL